MTNRTFCELLAVTSMIVLFVSCSRPAAKPSFDLLDSTHYTPVKPFDDPGGMRIAAGNSSEKIRNLTSINGLSISELEKLMRPGNRDKHSSESGFLGADESLIDVLVADNDFVTSQGFTHADLAIPLSQICQHALAARRSSSSHNGKIDHAGVRWRVGVKAYKGFQYSPFNDETKTNFDFTIMNLSTGKSLNLSGLIPVMIERYGFYEGRGTPYRVEPKEIIDVLGLSLEQSDTE